MQPAAAGAALVAQLLLLSLLSPLSLLRADARTHAPKAQQQPQRAC